MKKTILYVLLIIIALSSLSVANLKLNDSAVVLTIQGGIGPAAADYVQRGIADAQTNNARMVILQMDTPGGLDKSMRVMVKAILNSSIPVIGFVAPRGARAASAGTFLLYATHLAAMAPGTNLGAASPVSIGGGGMVPGAKSSDKNKKSHQDTMKNKVTKDARAYIRSLAQLRGRNIQFAEKAVSEAATLTATEALKKNVINLMAKDLPDLLIKANGLKVEVKGQSMVLDTKNIKMVHIVPDWRTRLLSVITDPSVAYILLLIGIYGLFFEFANPGFVLPGVAGAIALILAMYAFQLLPISYAGLGLILLGVMFMVAEAFIPSFGALGIGGVLAFIAGSVLLLDSNLPAYQIAWPLIIAMALVNVVFFFMVIGVAIRARRRRVVSGREDLIDRVGEALEDIEHTGQAKIAGEIWNVETSARIKKGQPVKVTASKGLTLTVEPIL